MIRDYKYYCYYICCIDLSALQKITYFGRKYQWSIMSEEYK